MLTTVRNSDDVKGILVFEIFNDGDMPYKELKNEEVMDYVATGHTMAQPKQMPRALYLRILDCWNLKPSERPSFAEMHAHFTTSGWSVMRSRSSMAAVQASHSERALTVAEEAHASSDNPWHIRSAMNAANVAAGIDQDGAKNIESCNVLGILRGNVKETTHDELDQDNDEGRDVVTALPRTASSASFNNKVAPASVAPALDEDHNSGYVLQDAPDRQSMASPGSISGSQQSVMYSLFCEDGRFSENIREKRRAASTAPRDAAAAVTAATAATAAANSDTPYFPATSALKTRPSGGSGVAEHSV